VAALAALAMTWDSGPDLLDRVEEGAVGVIDPAADGIVEQYALGGRPGALAGGAGSVWVLDTPGSTVSRIQPEQAVTTIPVDRNPVGLAFGAGSLWVTSPSEGTLSQVSPDANRVVQSLDVGNAPTAVAVGFGAVWVASEVDRTVTRIDLARPAARERISVGAGPTALSAGAGAVWAASEEGGAVFRIEPRTRDVVRSIDVGEGPSAIAADETGVWVADRRAGSVWRIDPATDAVSNTIDAGPEPAGITLGAGAVWVADAADGTVSAIDPATGRPRATIPVESSPAAVAVSGGRVWTSALASRASHRGGTLNVEDQPPCEVCFEPSSYDSEAFTRLSLAYDGLLTYRRAGGSTYGPLLPNLAEDVPEPSADGRTYVFRLRRGIRYSDGRLVRPEDVRSSLEEHLRRVEWGPSYKAIVGASDCRIRPPRCDLSRGIRTDARARTVTFRLREPDPEFLHALAFPFAYVVPKGRTFGPGVQPPGTGPYRFVRFDRRGTRLVRNPHFREWSRDARPDGFPDQIVVRHNPDVEPQIRAVREGRADVLAIGKLFGTRVTPERMLALRTGQPGLLHTNPEAELDYLWLNSRVPPFDDVRVRQALNYAADRRRIAELAGTPEEAQATCQFVPPGFPGYAPSCRYTVDPGPAGAWKAPDLARARRLVARSGTAGAKVVVWGYREKKRLFEYVAELLDRLGYRTSLRMSKDYFASGELITDPANRAQAGIQGFAADGPTPSTFAGGFRCRSQYPPSPGRYNPEAFCDQELERRVGAALRARGAEAERRWQGVYGRLADVAPAVPLVNRRSVTLVSERVGNHQHHPMWGTLYDQLWVR
jgi:peptide/nickel transport system substrate-binding protein